MKMTVVQEGLWSHLRSYPLDLPDHPLPFSTRLRAEQGWPRAFTDRVVGEYRRFLLLAATADDMLVPSDAVDQAWHLHLLDTRAYWDGLCGLVGKPIHHMPPRGGAVERGRHRDGYEVTLERYREVFGEEAPADVWPRGEARFAGRYRRVNVEESHVVPKRLLRNVGVASLGALALAGCAAAVTAGVLVSLGIILVLAIMVGAVVSQSDAAPRKHTRDGGSVGSGCGGDNCPGSGDSGGGCGGGSGCG